MNRRAHVWFLFSAVFAAASLVAVPKGNGAGVEEDHLKGYQIKDEDKVQPPSTYTLTNPFGSETCQLKKAKFFLVHSAKDGGNDPLGGPAGDFICYKAKCIGSLPPPTDADDQFGAHTLTTKKTKLVCVPACQRVDGVCWFLAGDGVSCDTTCANMGKTCDPATVSFAGTGGNDSNCQAVLSALGVTLGFSTVSCGAVPGIGCVSNGFQTARCTTAATTCAAAAANTFRVCACQ